jgi:hypothetical protein
MKFTVEMGVLIGFLIITILVSLMNVGNILPYSGMRNYSKYEGFKEGGSNSEDLEDSSEEPVVKKNKESDSNEKTSSYQSPLTTSKTRSSSDDSSSDKTSSDKTSSDKTSSDKKSEYSKNDEKDNIISSVKKIQDEAFEVINSLKEKAGMQPMGFSPVGSDTKLDMFSLNRGSNSCIPSSYSNSQGYICMTPEQQKLLSTRGGNQSGSSMSNVQPAN